MESQPLLTSSWLAHFLFGSCRKALAHFAAENAGEKHDSIAAALGSGHVAH